MKETKRRDVWPELYIERRLYATLKAEPTRNNEKLDFFDLSFKFLIHSGSLHAVSKLELIVGGKIMTEHVCLNNHKLTVLQQTYPEKL